MPISSEQNAANYVYQLPLGAPDYLTEWAETYQWENNALIWRVDWYLEPLTGLRRRCARGVCTACGEHMILDYQPGGTCNGNAHLPRLWLYNRVIENWGETYCPECGAKVRSEHINGAEEYASETRWPMTLSRAMVPGAQNRLMMTLWKVRKFHTRDGERRFLIWPWEAYIVEENKIVRCTKHAGSFHHDYPIEWKQTKGFSDTMRDIVDVVCPEGVQAATAGTTAENAKLELYLQPGAITFPVSWMRIWQKHRNAETLLTCGAWGIISNLIGQEKRDGVRGYTQIYAFTIPKLQCIRWKERRPGRMLGMDRGELRDAIAMQRKKNLGGKTWRTWLEARTAGKKWTLEDAAALEHMKSIDRGEEYLARPVRIVRYLDAQKRRWKTDEPNETMLLDYWNMLRTIQPGAWDAEEMWPERLRREHDRLVRIQERAKNEKLDAAFAARAAELEVLEYHSGGLFIAAPKSSGELTVEGKCLHHCVASYAQRHADGKTAILFIRKENEPKTPFFTLEWSEAERKVVQNRGMRNCARTPEVQAFEVAWLRWVLAGAKRGKDGEPLDGRPREERSA